MSLDFGENVVPFKTKATPEVAQSIKELLHLVYNNPKAIKELVLVGLDENDMIFIQRTKDLGIRDTVYLLEFAKTVMMDANE